MPRKGPAPKRKLPADNQHRSVLVTQVINKIMLDGKRSTAEHIVYGAFDVISERTGGDPVATLKKAIDNVKPALEVKSRRVGGATYQIPIEVRAGRGTTLALRWLIDNARARREHSMVDRLAGELMDAANNAGASVKKREDTHKMADANKAFAHYRW